MGTEKSKTETGETNQVLREAISEDLRMLGYLHAKELDAQTLEALQAIPFLQHLGIVLTSERATEALRVLDTGLSGVLEQGDGEGKGAPQDQAQHLEDLACDYTGIYLTHQCGVSPCESPWRDEDKLERQQPMFEVRDWYHKYGLAAKDWRKRPDDHLSTQLAFAGHLMGDLDIDLVETAHFLDQHLFFWVGSFAENVAGRCATPFYAGLSMLTYAYLEELRDMIETLTDLPRPPSVEENEERERVEQREELDAAFAPGLGGPGW